MLNGHGHIISGIALQAVSLAAAAALLSACELRPLYIEGVTPVEVLVVTDWTQLGGDPSGATICFYPEGGGAPHKFRTNSVTRAHVQVPSGYYNVMVFNRTVDEFGTMSFAGIDTLASARALLDEKLFSWIGRVDTVGRTVYEPEEIVVGRSDHFKVRSFAEREAVLRGSGRESDPTAIVDSVMVAPKRVRYTGTVSVRIQGIQNLRSVRGYLTGMGGSAYLSTRRAGNVLGTHVLESWKVERDEADYTKGWLRGEFYCFGLPEQYVGDRREQNNRLFLQFRLVDNKTVIQDIRGVGTLIDQNDRELTDNIVISEAITLPDVKPEGGTESGFDVNITDWEDPIDIPIGI